MSNYFFVNYIYVCVYRCYFLSVFFSLKVFFTKSRRQSESFLYCFPQIPYAPIHFFSFLISEDLLVQETSKKQNYTSKLIGVTNPRQWWVIVAGSSSHLIPSFLNSFIWRAIPFVLIFGERILTLGIKFISKNGSKLNYNEWYFKVLQFCGCC